MRIITTGISERIGDVIDFQTGQLGPGTAVRAQKVVLVTELVDWLFSLEEYKPTASYIGEDILAMLNDAS